MIQFLNQTIDWYRHRAAEQQLATEPDDVLVLNDNRQLADQIVRLAFDFAQAEAESLANGGAAAQNQNQSTSASQYQPLLQLEAKINQQAQASQSEVETLRQKLETATGNRRQTLQAQLAETQAELDLAKARKDTIHNMTEFVSGTGNNGLGATDLRAQVQALADSVPVLSTARNSAAFPKEQLGPALIAATNRPPSGVWDLIADLFALSRKIHTIDVAIQQTDALAIRGAEIRSPFLTRIKELSTQGDELAKQADTASPAELEQQKQQTRFPGRGIPADRSSRAPFEQTAHLASALPAQFEQLEERYTEPPPEGDKRAAGQTWPAGNHDRNSSGSSRAMATRRVPLRPQCATPIPGLLLRKVVMWFLIVVIVAFAFASKLGSVVTFAGLITAGIVVALQNVILSIVGYFLLIGKYGFRVGDRVQIGGVTGEVIDIGLVRLHLMELSGNEYSPTGRVVAFSNTIVFQPTSGLFKQIPGTNFLWHEITLRLSPENEYDSVKKRLLRVVKPFSPITRKNWNGKTGP